MRPEARWVPFTAKQHVAARPPGFVWDADIRMLPFLPVRVRDTYLAGGATMEGRIAGVVPVVDQRGSAQLAQSALARWLGEAVWFPTALLPVADTGGAVRWEPIDDDSARAVVTDGRNQVQAEFRFAPTGAPLSMRADRYRDVDGEPVLTPFEGTYGACARFGGVRVPASAEVAWLLPAGRYAYWRGRPASIRFAA